MARIIKCENCEAGGILLEGGGRRWKYLIGWSSSGRSVKFPDQKYAFWCPDCQSVSQRFSLRQLFPTMSEPMIDALIEEMELEKLREN